MIEQVVDLTANDKFQFVPPLEDINLAVEILQTRADSLQSAVNVQ